MLIAHLAAADANVLAAIRDPDAFEAVRKETEAVGAEYADLVAAEGAALLRETLLDRWRTGRTEAATTLRDLPLDHELPWYDSRLTPALMTPLRLMETWAHGRDIHDALGVPHPPTPRLHPIASLGVIGRELSFHAAQLPPPAAPFRIELTAPDGHLWTWGPPSASQQVTGTALDFCLRVTHRRTLPETGLVAVGEDARKWLEIARVFL